MSVYANALAMIGHTPLVALHRLDTGVCQLFAKLECQNPGGSIKDRIALRMIEAAEQRGDLKPGMTIVEATAGNTGIGLALVAALKGYQLLIVLPDKMSREKIFHLKAMGAQVIMTRSDVNRGHPEYYQDYAERLSREMPNAFYINQFANPDNVEAHYHTTAPEIWEQMEENIDAFVCGVGSSGTLSGVGKFLKEKNPNIKIILADPVGSILREYVETGHLSTKTAGWLVEGIGEDFIPSIADMSLVDAAYSVTDAESFHTARELLRKEGIFGGSSTGTLLQAALNYCRAQTTPKRVVTLVGDSGNKYLSKCYNDTWMVDQGFLKRTLYGDLRDLITYQHSERATITVKAEEPLMIVHNRMKLHDVSQLPVLDGDHLLGIVDESDLLLAVYHDRANFRAPAKQFMTERLEKIDCTAKIEDLLPILNKGYVAIVMNDDQFAGIITRIDLVNYLRRTQEI